MSDEPADQPGQLPTDPTDPATGLSRDSSGDLSGALDAVEGFLLGEAPSLTRVQVAEQAGVSVEVSEQLWRLLGFPQAAPEDVAFTPADVAALRRSHELMRLGILSPQRQAALVRTWGRSYARLAEWQTSLLADVALEAGGDPVEQLTSLAGEVLPRIEELQAYVWRRHLAAAASRQLVVTGESGGGATPLAVCFVDIVGYTSHSKTLGEAELVDWIEHFEDAVAGVVVDHGGRIIKNIGDEVLLVADDPVAAAEIALEMTARGADDDDPFPAVRAGMAYGDVVSRLGDVFGPTVNIAARLTSVARPGTVLVDTGAHEALTGGPGMEGSHREPDDAGAPYSFRRLRRTSVKGYARLQPWALRRA